MKKCLNNRANHENLDLSLFLLLFSETRLIGLKRCFKIHSIFHFHIYIYIYIYIYISGSNEQLQQELEYTLLKPNFHCWWISKMQSDTLEEWYAIKFCFKYCFTLGKNDATETYGMLQTAFRPSCMKRALVFSIRDSRKAGSLWGMMRGLGGVRKSIHQSSLAKRLGLGLLCWGFKGVQEESPKEEASTLQIG